MTSVGVHMITSDGQMTRLSGNTVQRQKYFLSTLYPAT